MTTTTSATSGTSAATAAAAGTTGLQQIAGNFDEFLQLLTTQLQNQDPLDPMDTNSFTQELVEFSSVEQQVDMNTNMQTLISLQETSAATQALQLVGSTVTVNGNSATLSGSSSPATWSINSSGPGTGAVTITNSQGQTVYTGTTTLNAGSQSYSWNGQGNNGVSWPNGTYTIAVTGTGANGQALTVSTQVQGTVSGVDMSATPPTLTISGQSYPISSIQSLGNGGSTNTAANLSSLNTSISNLNSTLSSFLSSL